MKKADKKIIIAKIGAAYKLQGAFKLFSWAEPMDEVFNLSPWLTSFNPSQVSRLKKFNPAFEKEVLPLENKWWQLQLEKGEMIGKGLVAKIKGVNTPEMARVLTHCTVFVPRSSLEKTAEDSYYWCDLIGLEVINQDGVILGAVNQLFETKVNSILEIKKEDVTTLIPFLPAFIKKVELQQYKIWVEWYE